MGLHVIDMRCLDAEWPQLDLNTPRSLMTHPLVQGVLPRYHPLVVQMPSGIGKFFGVRTDLEGLTQSEKPQLEHCATGGGKKRKKKTCRSGVADGLMSNGPLESGVGGWSKLLWYNSNNYCIACDQPNLKTYKVKLWSKDLL